MKNGTHKEVNNGDHVKADKLFGGFDINDAIQAMKACDKIHEDFNLWDAEYKESNDSLEEN